MAQPASNPKIDELRLRLKADPKSRIFFPLAEELRKAGQTDEAEQVLRTGLSAHPTYLSAWVSLGRVLREQKKDGDALEPLQKALQLDPGNVVAARLLGDAYLSLGEKLEAIKKYKLVQALIPSDQELSAIVNQLDRELHPPPPAALEPEPEPEPEAEAEAEEVPRSSSEFLGSSATESLPAEQPEEPAFTEEPAFAEELRGTPRNSEEPASSEEPPAPEEPVFPAEPEEPLIRSPFAPDDSSTGRSAADADALAALITEQRIEMETGDSEPMLVAHDASPFEEPLDSYTSDAVAVEGISGFHVDRAPLVAEVPSYVEEEPAPSVEDALPSPEPVLAFTPDLPVSDEADIFAPAAEPVADEPLVAEPLADEPFPADEPVPDPAEEDFTNTLTMADLYARQGALTEARHIYENILARDPENHAVREKLDAILAPAEPDPTGGRAAKIARLENWLARVSRKEGARV